MKILVTGAHGGIGKDTAFALARRGHEVIATTKTAKEAEVLKVACKKEGLEVQCETLDLLVETDVERAAEWEIDVLINNAGIGESGPLAEIPMERVRENFEVNVFGTLTLTQEIVPQMLKRGSGRIVMVTSVAGKIVLPYLGAYSGTKFALEAFSDALRQELAPHGIFVSVIEPGAIETGFNERMNESKYKWFGKGSLFAGDAERMKSFEHGLVKNQHKTDSVVAAMVDAVESSAPKTRYVRPSSNAKLVWLAGIVPDRVRDWAIGRMIKG